MESCHNHRILDGLREVHKYSVCLKKYTEITSLYQVNVSKPLKNPTLESIFTDLTHAGDQLFWMLTSLEMISRNIVKTRGPKIKQQMKKKDHNSAQTYGSYNMRTNPHRRKFLSFFRKKKTITQ